MRNGLFAGALLFPVILPGCATPFGFGGEDWGGGTDTGADPSVDVDGLGPESDSGSGAGGPFVVASHAWCAEGEALGMSAIVDPDDVWITHVGFSDECTACADWIVGGTVYAEELRVEVVYEDVDTETCDCDCGVFGIEFVMNGFPTGTWTVAAGEDEVSFDVAGY